MLRNEPLNMNAKRSIGLIVESLFQLLDEKSFESITITDITKNAGIVRNTFYAHFTKKEDVILYHIVEMFSDKIKLETSIKDSDYDTVLMYFEVWQKNQELLDLLERSDLLHLISGLKDFIQLLGIDKYIYSVCDVSPKAFKYANTLYIDALASIVNKWSKTGKEETPEELADIYRELIR